MYYHVDIWRDFDGQLVLNEVNLELALISDRVLPAYRQGSPLTLGGRTVGTLDIGRIRILETDEPVNLLAGYHDETLREMGCVYTTEERNVTDQWITGPPGQANSEPTLSPPHTEPNGDARKVFVVHGRNAAAAEAMFTFLRAVGLQPLEWTQGIRATGLTTPYIGDILDKLFLEGQAVVVLFTPDDLAMLHPQFRTEVEAPYETMLTGQARPNVLFEAGMAMGRHPDQTILVELGNLRPFSDVAGRHVVRLDDTPERRQELVIRLQNAGCPVDMNAAGASWYRAGEFTSALESTSLPREKNDWRDFMMAILDRAIFPFV